MPNAARAVKLSEKTTAFLLNIAFKPLFAQSLGVAVEKDLEAPAVTKNSVFIGPGQRVVTDMCLPSCFNSSLMAADRLMT